MSAAASALPSRPLRREDPRQRLVVVAPPARRRRPKLMYGIVAVAGALAIGAAQMTLSIMTTQTSYEVSKLSQQQRTLTLQKQVLTDQIAGLSSPQYLAANATALGMVIDESPNYLRLSDGAVLGSGQAAAGASSVDALGRAAVPNSLISSTPLVTNPDATIEGVPVAAPVETPAEGATGAVVDPATPPPLTAGLPTPSTH